MPTNGSPTTLKMVPMSRQDAATLVKKLLRSYASLNLHDPEGYIAEVVTLLSGYPLWAGESVIEEVRKTSKFIPNISDIHPKLETAVKPFRYAAEWEAQSKRQLLASPGSYPESDEHRAAVVERIRKEAAAAGMPILGDKKADYDPQFTESAVKEKLKISDEQWAAIPDAPPASHWQSIVERHKPGKAGD
mgnify:FL=1